MWWWLIWLLALVLLSACQPATNTFPQTGVGTETPPSASPTAQPVSSSGGQTPTSGSILQAPVTILGAQEYLVQEFITLVNQGPGEPSRQNLWVALVSDVSPYQALLERQISCARQSDSTEDDLGDCKYELINDEYGNQIAEFDLSDMPVGEGIRIQFDYRVVVNNLAYDLSTCQGELPDFFTQPELHVESKNPHIIDLSEGLSQGQDSACEQARAFYDYIGDNLVYSYNGRDWGAQAALGEMGADCTEYASLMMALSRAAGIPAHYFEGLYVSPQGAEGIARTEHAWLEVYLPGIGWTPMDPTLGRLLVSREDYFAAAPPDRIIVSRGRHPASLRGASYWSHIYWPGDSTKIEVTDSGWVITPAD